MSLASDGAVGQASPRGWRALAARPLVVVSAAALAAVMAALGVLFGIGGHLHEIASPSMAEAAPVGSLVVVTPGVPQVGDVITFTPQDATRPYTHRVIGADEQGYETKGDLNGSPDPWRVQPAQVEGVVRATVPGGGYLLHGLPIVMVALLFVWSMAHFLTPRSWRWPVWLTGATGGLAIASAVVQPWVKVQAITYRAEGEGVVTSLVSTGVLPIRVRNGEGAFIDLRPGQQGVLGATTPNEAGLYQFTPTMHLSGVGWVVAGLLCAIPTILAAVLVFRSRRQQPRPGRGRGGLLRAVCGAATVAVGLVMAMTVLTTTSFAAFGARISASTNLVGTRAYFTCLNGATQSVRTAFAHGMQTIAVSEPDITGHGSVGVWAKAPTTTTFGNVGCNRDEPQRATVFATNCLDRASTAAAAAPPTTFAISLWFNTTAAPSGRMMGFSNARTGVTDTKYDRQVYLDNEGRVVFSPSTGKVIASPAGKTYADGTWHHVLATTQVVGSGAGAGRLFVDGRSVATGDAGNLDVSYNGWWRIGCGANRVTNANGVTITGPSYYSGAMQFNTVYLAAVPFNLSLELLRAGIF